MFWKRNMDEPKWKTREQKERRWWSCSTRVGKQERNDHFFCPVWLRFGVDKSHWRKSNELWIWGQTLQISLSFLITVYSCLAVFCLGQFYCHMSAVESLRSLETFRRNVSTAVSTPQVNIGGRWKKAFEILACLWLGKNDDFFRIVQISSCKLPQADIAMLRTAVAGASQAQTEELVRQVFRDVHQKKRSA